MTFPVLFPNGKLIFVLFANIYESHFNSTLLDDPAKLKKLMAQLKDLQDKGFIRPTILHGVLRFCL